MVSIVPRLIIPGSIEPCIRQYALLLRPITIRRLVLILVGILGFLFAFAIGQAVWKISDGRWTSGNACREDRNGGLVPMSRHSRTIRQLLVASVKNGRVTETGNPRMHEVLTEMMKNGSE